MKNCALLAFLFFLVVYQPFALVSAQTGTFFNQRDDQYRLLGFKRAKEAYDAAKADYDRQLQLFEHNLSARADLDHARSVLSDAEVNYQQSLLAVLFEQQYVTINSAVKYYAQDGTRHVRLTVANASGGSAEYWKLLNTNDSLFRSLHPEIVNNVYVSLLNDQNAVISKPYESKIVQLVYGEPVEEDFQLLQDLDAVTVSLIYGSGTQRQMKIFLEKDVTTNKVAVQSEQFSQEVDLGSAASYDLGLELYSGTNNTFSLEAVNLPVQISKSFKDPISGARVSQVKFTETTRSKRASLEVVLPSRPSEVIVIDKSIRFFVAAVPPERAGLFSDGANKIWTQEELDKLDVGYVTLELTPRGKGMLLVRCNQLFQTINAGESAAMTMNLLNEGSNRLDNIEYRFDLPLNWQKRTNPESVSRLEIGQDTTVDMMFIPPPDATSGRYDIRVRTSGQSNGRPVNGEDKTLNVEVQARSNVVGTLLIVFLIVGLVTGIVVFGVRLSRK